MINEWFYTGMILAFCFRFIGGQIISLTIGFASGIILFEFIKFVIWKFKKGV